MKDHLGQKLQIGDWVVVSRDKQRYQFGKISKYLDGYVYFVGAAKNDGWFPSSLEKLSDEESMIFMLGE